LSVFILEYTPVVFGEIGIILFSIHCFVLTLSWYYCCCYTNHTSNLMTNSEAHQRYFGEFVKYCQY